MAAGRYSQAIWDWIKQGNPTPSFLRFAREENLEPLQPTASPDVPFEDSPPELVAHGRGATSSEASGEIRASRRARRRESRIRQNTSIEDRFPSPPFSTARATRADVNAADSRSPPSTSGSLDDRLKEAASNTRSNKGPRSRADTLRPLRKSSSSISVVHAPKPTSVSFAPPNEPVLQPVQAPKRASGQAVRSSVREFTPEIQAILNYQSKVYKKPEKIETKDPKAAERRHNEQVFTWCNVCTDDLTKPTWCTHPEFEGIALDLLNDARINRGNIVVDGTDYAFDLPQIRGNLIKLFAMIHPQNLCTLLTENVQADAPHWMVFTTNGTLLGYSEGTTIDQARTVAALTSAAWRMNHELVLKGLTDLPYPGLFLKDVEIFPYDQTEAGLKCMFAEVNNSLIAVHDVKERLLVAAMLPLDAVEPSTEAVTEEMKSLQVSQETKAAVKESEELKDVKEAVENASSSSSGSHLSASTESSIASGNSKGKGKATGEGDGDEDPYEGMAFSKKDVLMMKAEAMAEILLQDLVDFVMPNEFY